MRSLLARLAVLGAFAVSISACSGSNSSLPFAGPPNNAGGNSGTFQTASNGSMLVRFVNGAPDNGGTSFSGPVSKTAVDVCIDNFQYSGGAVAPIAQYGKAASGANGAQNTLVALSGGGATAGITHTIAVYPTPLDSFGNVLTAGAGLECPTAPGPYLGVTPTAFTTLNAVANTRITVVLAGSPAGTGKGTLGLYIFSDPVYFTSPVSPSAYWHNAAPDFSAAQVGPKTVGFGYCTTTVTPCAVATALAGASSVAPGAKSGPAAATVNGVGSTALPAIPPGFYDGAGVAAGAPIPITSVATPALAAGQAPVYELIAVDAPAGGLNLIIVPEQSNGYGF